MSDWRSKAVERTCKRCAALFNGKYNSTSCPPCRKAVKAEVASRFRENNPDYWREWSAANPKKRETRLINTYGVSLADWQAMAEAQGGGCAICGATGGWTANAGRLVVDHDHTTGAVRGLLCPPCNRGLGQFEDDPARLMAALEYLDSEIAEREAQAAPRT